MMIIIMSIWSVRTVRELSLALFPVLTQSICAGGDVSGEVTGEGESALHAPQSTVVFAA